MTRVILFCTFISTNKQNNKAMTNLEFLKENRNEVIKYYNTKVEGFYNVSLANFMTDLMVNFRKHTLSEGLKRMDLFCNLDDAKRRLGNFDCKIEVSYSKPYAESNHAKAVAYFGADKVQMMSSAK